jgi:hypothetical protein
VTGRQTYDIHIREALHMPKRSATASCRPCGKFP